MIGSIFRGIFMKLYAVNFGVALLLVAGLSGCGGGSSGGGSSATSAATVINAISGVAQGPLISGSIVIVQEVDVSLNPVSATPSSKTISGLGTYSTPPGTYIDLNASGKYFDLLLNTASAGSVILNSYASGADPSLNVNILTTLAYQRIKTLVNKTGPTLGNFAAARKQAETEVMSLFHISDPFVDQNGSQINFGSLDLAKGGNNLNGNGHNFLAAITSLFEFGNSSSQLGALLASFQSDLADNGCIDTTATRSALINSMNSMSGLNPATAAASLSSEYSSANVSFLPTDIKNWLDQDNDGVVGKFKFPVLQTTVGTAYTFPIYTVGASDHNALYSLIGDPNSNDPNSTATLTVTPANAVLGTTVSMGSSLTVHTGDTVLVTRTPTVQHGSSMAYLQSTNSPACTLPIDAKFNLPIARKNVARYDFNPFGDGGSLTTARTDPTITLLQNGQVLVTGGMTAGVASKSADLYDPATNKWSVMKTMNVARVGHTATLLNDGQVLVVGGDGGDKVPVAGTAELYNPSANVWTALASSTKTAAYSPTYGHIYHTATLLNTGQVLIVGGNLFSPTGVLPTNTAAELYTPASGVIAGASTGTWASYNMNATGLRYHHTATLLQDGRVFIAGGFDGKLAIGSAELFTPGANSWTPLAGAGSLTNMANIRYSHTATLLNDGRVLIAGGFEAADKPALKSAELFDPGDLTPSATLHVPAIAPAWSLSKGINASASAGLNTVRFSHVAQLLADGNVLLAGGTTNSNGTLLSGAELYYPATDSFVANGNMAYARANFAAVMLSTKQVLLVGGQAVTAAETFK